MESGIALEDYAADSDCTRPSPRSFQRLEGHRIETAVPLLPSRVELRNLMLPSCLATIPWTTQRPSPVPPSALVVKKGSTIFTSCSLGIPCPLSATVRR